MSLALRQISVKEKWNIVTYDSMLLYEPTQTVKRINIVQYCIVSTNIYQKSISKNINVGTQYIIKTTKKNLILRM